MVWFLVKILAGYNFSKVHAFRLGWGLCFIVFWLLVWLFVILIVLGMISAIGSTVLYFINPDGLPNASYFILLYNIIGFIFARFIAGPTIRLIRPIQFRSMPWEVNDLTFDVIEGCLKETVEIFFRVLGEKYEDTLVTKQADRRGVYYNPGGYTDSIASLNNVHTKLLRYFPPKNILLLHISSIIATMLNYSEMYIEALQLYKTVHQLKLELKLDEHESTLAIRHNIALVLFNLQEYTKAKESALKVLADKVRILGPTHTSTTKTKYLIVEIEAGADNLHSIC
jgi:hypothetical protein